MKLLCEVPLTEVKTFQESYFKWLAKGDSEYFLFTFENRKRMRVFAIKNKNVSHNNKQAAPKAHEAQSASLAEPRQCTSSSWNRDESLLALVVDRRQIYFWEVHRNTFVQFKPKYLMQEQQHQQHAPNEEAPLSGRRRASGKYIDHIAWSKMSDKLAICLGDAQILLCNVASTNSERGYVSSWERLIGNSEGLLKQINSIQVSDHADLFVCSSVDNELLAMTFDGGNRLYCQAGGDGQRVRNMKFSPLIRQYDARLGAYRQDNLWLAFQSNIECSLYLRRISLKYTSAQVQEDVPSSSQIAVPLLQDSEHATDETMATPCSLVDLYWLNSARLIVCLSTGSIQLLSINDTSQSLLALSEASPSLMPLQVTRKEVLRLRCASKELEDESAPIEQLEDGDTLKAFELVRNTRQSEDSDQKQSFAFAAVTNYRLHYYEIYESRETTIGGGEEFAFEHFDDLDLSEALGRVNLTFERLEWSQDCSMLSIQLSSGHLLIYQTQLQHDHMVASHRAKTAYLSGPSEITLLNYGFEDIGRQPIDEKESLGGRRNSSSSSRAGTPSGANAIILSLPFKPSLLAIGPRHLAVALNNRIRFYTIETILRLNNQSMSDNEKSSARTKQQEFCEQEYVTLVVGIGLSSRFVATLLDDGRLKLHSLNQLKAETYSESPDETRSDRSLAASDDDPTDGLMDDERFFPDPGHTTQRISAFTLTEELLLFSTSDCHIHVFSLKHWQIVQTHDHSASFKAPVAALKPNERGNKFVCLLKAARQQASSMRSSNSNSFTGTDANVYLYDLFSNRIFKLDCNKSQLANEMSQKLMGRLLERLPEGLLVGYIVERASGDKRAPVLSCIRDVVWDTDGRSLLFIQTKSIHVLAILEHTLEQEEPLAIYADSAKKPASHSTLYVSEGIVSYQTSLGRVINSILETHDDELKLTRLEHRIKLINDQYARRASSGQSIDLQPPIEGHLKVMLLKLEYLRSILPIYSLPKCRDICEHLMEERAFKLVLDSELRNSLSDQSNTWIEQVDQLIWRQLASWAIFTLNLNFAKQIFQQHGLSDEATLLSDLFESMKATGLNSRTAINEKLLNLLERL